VNRLLQLLDVPSFFAEAACRGMPADLFFPAVKGAPIVGDPSAGAKEVCAACPVQAECLAYAVEHKEEHGVWGGEMMPLYWRNDRRRRLEANRGRRLPHGLSGYVHHGCRCDVCRAAKARSNRRRPWSEVERVAGTLS